MKTQRAEDLAFQALLGKDESDSRLDWNRLDPI